MDKWIHTVLNWMAALAAILLIFIVFSISYSILSRTIGLPSPVWVVQFNEYALLWITFLGTGWVLARDKHVSIDLLTGRFSQKNKSYFQLFHGFLGTVICLILFWYGFWTTFGQFKRNVVDVQAIDVPKFLILMVIPIGFFFLAIQFARQFWTVLKTLGRAFGPKNPEQD